MFTTRESGILVHPTSFPGEYGMGDLGPGAYKFLDFLKESKQRLWQVLPLGPTGYGDSPYQSFSAFAGNHYLISFDLLAKEGLLNATDLANKPVFDPSRINYGDVIPYKMQILRRAYDNFKTGAKCKHEYKKFCTANKFWLNDYALFTAIKETNDGNEWSKWPVPLKNRQPAAIKEAATMYADEIDFCKFLQYEFYRQWLLLKVAANDMGIKIIGDMPIYVAQDSADVWASPELYQVDKNGQPTAVAGCPPDYFSETGQLWGNPLYNWDIHKKTGYKWWCTRVKAVLELVDIVRIDHFRGFDTYWSIPYGETTAINGKWKKGPGKALFTTLKKELGNLPIIAEDLGDLTESVHKLRKGVNLPGMRILQFAFTPGANSTYLPHNYEDSLTIVYTGTHDNNTTRGWYNEIDEAERDYLRRYFNISGENIAWDLIRAAFASSAIFAIVPMQDVMSLDANQRMNKPGDAQGWWAFRYTDDMLQGHQAEKLAYLSELFYRGEFVNLVIQ